MNLPLEKKDFTVAISLTGRYLEHKPICLYAVDHREPAGNRLHFETLAWLPATAALTPAVAAEFLRYGLGKLSSDLVESPSRANFFVAGPLTLAKQFVRRSERSFGDLDRFNYFVGERLPYLTMTDRIGPRQKLSRDRMRSSLELFHGLLWEQDWLEDSGLDSWRRQFSLGFPAGHLRNLFEVHLGERAVRDSQNANPGANPQPGKRRPRLLSRLAEEHGVKLPGGMESLPWDRETVDRGLMLLLASLELQTKTGSKTWEVFGEKVELVFGTWREGEVIGKAVKREKTVTGKKWICCLDKFNLQSVVAERVLPADDLWMPVEKGTPHREAQKSKNWPQVKKGDLIELVHHSSWKSGDSAPKVVIPFCTVKVIESFSKYAGGVKSQFVFPKDTAKKGGKKAVSEPVIAGFDIEFLEFSEGRKVAFPEELLEEGPLVPFERFSELTKTKGKRKKLAKGSRSKRSKKGPS